MDKRFYIPVSATIVLVIVLVWLLTPNTLFFKNSILVTLEDVNNRSYKMNPDDVSNNNVIIDLRSPYEFAIHHSAGAINIANRTVLNADFIDFADEALEKKIKLLIYSNKSAEAAGIALLMRQLGYNNVFWIETMTNIPDSVEKQRPLETAAANFADEFRKLKKPENNTTKVTEKPKPITITPINRPKAAAAEGGC